MWFNLLVLSQFKRIEGVGINSMYKPAVERFLLSDWCLVGQFKYVLSDRIYSIEVIHTRIEQNWRGVSLD